MIPANIHRQHVVRAIAWIKKSGVPSSRRSKKYHLKYKRKHYPPKYVISVANKYANGTKLSPPQFAGGKETNDFLRALAFTIVGPLRSDKQVSKRRTRKPKTPSKGRHSERCRDCRVAVSRLLGKIYGEVKEEHKFQVGTHPDDLRHTVHYKRLKEIYKALQRHRGFKDFVKAKTLRGCDYFVPDPGFIVELDESQHFTSARRLTLERYPQELKLGFDKQRWLRLCQELDRRDDNPAYRDEQRAWYETLRDFLPAMVGLNPTVRLFRGDFAWCSLDPSKSSHVKTFQAFLEGKRPWYVSVREERNPSFARIIIAHDWQGHLGEAREVLRKVCSEWPSNTQVKFLITCGGFIQFEWPPSMSRDMVGDNRCPNKEAVDILVSEAKKHAEDVLRGNLAKKLGKRTRYLTLGIDSSKKRISKAQTHIGVLHIELVFLIDQKTGTYYTTGKSYPTSGQQTGLLRIQDAKSHLVNTPFGNVMVLGCHDLNVFSPRGKATTKKPWKKKIRKDFYSLARKERPQVVLHHPHTTDSTGVWGHAWNELARTAPGIQEYVSAGRYFNPEGERSDLERVLSRTKRGNSIDFIVRREYEMRS